MNVVNRLFLGVGELWLMRPSCDRIFIAARVIALDMIMRRIIGTARRSRCRWMLWSRLVYFSCENLSRAFLILEMNPHPAFFTWARTTVMQWNARIR